MKSKFLKYISNIFFGVGLALSAYAIYRIISIRASLPEGVCPIDSGRPVLIAAIIFFVISFIASLFTSDKRNKDEKS